MKDSENRVVMARNVANKWLQEHTLPEFRFKVLNPKAKKFGSLLRGFRDGKVRLAKVSPLKNLGVKEEFDGLVVWSSDLKAMTTLREFFEKRGMETNWIW